MTRSLHILLSVPVLAAVAIAVPPSAHAATATAPQRLVVVIDPGHGGAPDPNHPDMPFDPGAIAPSNGLLEKDATLAVSKLLRDDLVLDGVDTVLTRSTDISLDVPAREAIANSHHADLFMSIHFNSFTDPSANGSLVLYPRDSDLAYASAVSTAMFTGLAGYGIANDGVTLRDNWWIHTTMPTVTVEPAFLSNTREAALIGSPDFQARLALSLRAGMEAYDPDILQRKAQIAAWEAAHPASVAPASPASAARPVAAAAPAGLGWLLRDAILVTLLAAAVRWPRLTWRLLRLLYRVGRGLVTHLVVRRAATRRRRRAVQRRAHAARSQRLARPHHVYDELFL
ncbi:MAG: N-acetylmuramoyl-L-alanine amidase family protein [Candidatus Dormibacteria bacterium]